MESKLLTYTAFKFTDVQVTAKLFKVPLVWQIFFVSPAAKAVTPKRSKELLWTCPIWFFVRAVP